MENHRFSSDSKVCYCSSSKIFQKAISQHGVPEVVTIDKSGANTAALKAINTGKPEKETIGILQNKYLNK